MANHHDRMNEAFHKAEKKMAGKNSGGYDHHPETLMPKNARANGGGSSGEHAERGEPAAQRRADRANKTGYGSKNVGADIGGGVED